MTINRKLWRAPIALLALGFLNIASGALQLSNIYQGPTPEIVASEVTNPHYFEVPVPVVVHIVGGGLFSLLVPLQFLTARYQNRIHRWTGRVLWCAGLVAALSGLWMNQFFPAFGSGLKFASVWAMGGTMTMALVLALRAVRNHNIGAHRAWILRAVAMSLAPAVQRLVLLPIFILTGSMSILIIEIVVCGSFFLNLAVAEWAIRHGQINPASTIPAE